MLRKHNPVGSFLYAKKYIFCAVPVVNYLEIPFNNEMLVVRRNECMILYLSHRTNQPLHIKQLGKVFSSTSGMPFYGTNPIVAVSKESTNTFCSHYNDDLNSRVRTIKCHPPLCRVCSSISNEARKPRSHCVTSCHNQVGRI